MMLKQLIPLAIIGFFFLIPVYNYFFGKNKEKKENCNCGE